MKKSSNHRSSKFIVLVSIVICMFIGYCNIKSGRAEDSFTGYFLLVSGYFAITIAALASAGLLKRTFFNKT